MNTKKISIWELERYILGELPQQRMEQIEQMAKENAEISRQLDVLRDSDIKTLEQNPPDTIVPGIMEKADLLRENRTPRNRSNFFNGKRLLYIVPAAATAFLLLFVVLHLNRRNPGFIAGDSHYKGSGDVELTGPRIVILKKVNGGVEELNGGETVNSGDLIQIAYIPEGRRYGVIFSIDGRGVVTLHFPEKLGASTSLGEENKKLLGSAFELDDAPDFERFFFITSMEEMDVQEILKQAETLASSGTKGTSGHLNLPESYLQFFLLLYKGDGR